MYVCMYSHKKRNGTGVSVRNKVRDPTRAKNRSGQNIGIYEELEA
jgi:hypothetical protein